MDDYFRFSDAVYKWGEDQDACERSTPFWYDDLANLIKCQWSFTPTDLKDSWSFTPTDLKDDVESWDAANISSLFD